MAVNLDASAFVLKDTNPLKSLFIFGLRALLERALKDTPN